MPAKLWEEAVCLARQLGVYRVKLGLGLNYQSLKDRVACSGAVSAAAPSTGFVEMSGAQLLEGAGSVVELSDSEGMRLTIRLARGTALDVAEVVHAFRRRQA